VEISRLINATGQTLTTASRLSQ